MGTDSIPKQRKFEYYSIEEVKMTTAGLEPAIFGSEDRRLIHWATRPS